MRPIFLFRLRVLVALAATALVAACTSDSATGDATTGILIIEAKTAAGTPAASALVRIFSSASDFDLEVNPIDSARTDAQGQVTFEGLPKGPLWVLASQDNPETFLVDDNKQSSYQLPETPPAGSTATAEVVLQPNSEFTTLTFYTAAVASTDNPVVITVEDVAASGTVTRSLTGTRTSSPTAQNAANVVTIGRVRAGTYRIVATTENKSCRWVTEKTVEAYTPTNNGFNPVELATCSDFSVSVYTSRTFASGESIVVYLGADQSDLLGTLTQSVVSGTPPDCGTTESGVVVTASRPIGNYNLRAELKNGSGLVLQIWNFTLSATTPGECISRKIE